MRESSAALLLTLTGQTKVAVTENNRGLLYSFQMLTHFFKAKVFNANLDSYRGVLLKRLRWVMQF